MFLSAKLLRTISMLVSVKILLTLFVPVRKIICEHGQTLTQLRTSYIHK